MDNNQVWDLHRGRWDATTTAMRATSKCNAIDVSHSWRDSGGSNAVVVSGHMDGIVRVSTFGSFWLFIMSPPSGMVETKLSAATFSLIIDTKRPPMPGTLG